MIERKIHNHKSEIHIDYTIEQYGYHPDKLGRTSTKFVVANCRFCGQVMPIRKGFFNKAGSACHKKCRMKEQSICGSPFANKEVRDKSKKTNLERYGFEYASQNKEIGNRISIARKSKVRKKIDSLLFRMDPLGETSVHKYDDHISVSFLEHDLTFILNFNDSCTEQSGANRTTQLKKKEYWNVRGDRCFQVFEHQWEARSDQILNFLKTILHFNATKVAGRKCVVSSEDCRDFLNSNHIQGYGQGTIRYFNLEYGGEIIASMTASKHHRQGQGGIIVLNRLCFKDGFNVQGGASKLFKRMVDWAREKSYTSIVSWSDNCWTEGRIYGVLGFELVKEHPPDYFYWDIQNRRYVSKQTQQKKKTGCPEGMTEREWCIKRGLSRIYDTGKRLWTFEL